MLGSRLTVNAVYNRVNSVLGIEHRSLAVLFRVAKPLAWRDARGNDMTVTKPRDTTEDLRAGRDEIPRVAGGRGWRAGVRHFAAEAWRPAVDITERGDAYVVMVDIPDVKADEVEITVEDGLLTIRGRRHAGRAATGEKVHRSERGDGAFVRQLALPSSHVKADESEVSVRDGVLEIVMPRASAESSQLGVWEWEGGKLHGHEVAPARPVPASGGHPQRQPAAGRESS
jgi:HSP20 family protein